MQEPAIPSLQEKGYDCRYFLKMHGQYSFQFNQKDFLEWKMPVDFQSLFFISKDKRGARPIDSVFLELVFPKIGINQRFGKNFWLIQNDGSIFNFPVQNLIANGFYWLWRSLKSYTMVILLGSSYHLGLKVQIGKLPCMKAISCNYALPDSSAIQSDGISMLLTSESQMGVDGFGAFWSKLVRIVFTPNCNYLEVISL